MSTSGSYTADERRRIAGALDARHTPSCPVCGTELTRQTVEPVPGVAYVRHRVWVICPNCRRSASVDVKG